jgi:hypothetical protein
MPLRTRTAIRVYFSELCLFCVCFTCRKREWEDWCSRKVFLMKGELQWIYWQEYVYRHEHGYGKKVLKVRYSAFTIRNLNPYESKVFYEFLPNNRFVNLNLFIKPVPIPVLVPRACTCTFLRVTAGSKRTSVQSTSVQALKRLEPAVTRRKPVPVYLYLVPVPRTCTCTCTSYLYLVSTSYLYLSPSPFNYLWIFHVPTFSYFPRISAESPDLGISGRITNVYGCSS